MLRQVFDWAANRSTELITRYKQMASNIGFSDSYTGYEYSEVIQELNGNGLDGPDRGRRIEQEDNGEPFQACPPSRRKRRLACTQSSTRTEPNTVTRGHDVKRRCSPAGRKSDEAQISSNRLELGGLTLSFHRFIRLPLTHYKPEKEDPEWGSRETYAQIVKTPKAVRDEWLKLLNRQTGIMTAELDKWRNQFQIFSVSVETSSSTDKLGEPNRQDSVRHTILVQRLKKKLKEYFGEIFQCDELVLWQDGTKRKAMYFGPTEAAVEKETKSGKLQSKIEVSIHLQKETEFIYERSMSLTSEELEDSFSTMEDKFWCKQDHYLKRKSGKASRKRRRGPGPCEVVQSKKNIAPMEAHGNTEVPVSEQGRRKHRRQDATSYRLDNVYSSLKDHSLEPEEAAESLPKRLELMQAKYRRFMKKIEKARKEKKLQRR